MESFEERLKKWRKKSGLDQAQAAKVLKIGRTYYSRLENGRKTPGRFLLEKFEIVEGESVHFAHNELAEQTSRTKEQAEENGYASSKTPLTESRKLQVRKIPLIGWAQAGEIMDFEDVVDWDNLITTQIDDPRAMAIRIRGNSMEPKFSDGIIAVVSTSERPRHEQLVVARLKDEGVVFKRLHVIDPKKGLFRLISINPDYPPIERSEKQFLWIYPVKQTIQTHD